MQQKFCQKANHNNHKILGLCLFKDCNQESRLLCERCLVTHEQSHYRSVILLEYFNNGRHEDIKKKQYELDLKKQDSQLFNEQEYIELVQTIESRFLTQQINSIEQCKREIQIYIKEKLCQDASENNVMVKILEKLKQIGQKLSTITSRSKSDLDDLIDEFQNIKEQHLTLWDYQQKFHRLRSIIKEHTAQLSRNYQQIQYGINIFQWHLKLSDHKFINTQTNIEINNPEKIVFQKDGKLCRMNDVGYHFMFIPSIQMRNRLLYRWQLHVVLNKRKLSSITFGLTNESELSYTFYYNQDYNWYWIDLNNYDYSVGWNKRHNSFNHHYKDRDQLEINFLFELDLRIKDQESFTIKEVNEKFQFVLKNSKVDKVFQYLKTYVPFLFISQSNGTVELIQTQTYE